MELGLTISLLHLLPCHQDACWNKHSTLLARVCDRVHDVPGQSLLIVCWVDHFAQNPPSCLLSIEILLPYHEDIDHNVKQYHEQDRVVNQPKPSVKHLDLLDGVISENSVGIRQIFVELGEACPDSSQVGGGSSSTLHYDSNLSNSRMSRPL